MPLCGTWWAMHCSSLIHSSVDQYLLCALSLAVRSNAAVTWVYRYLFLKTDLFIFLEVKFVTYHVGNNPTYMEDYLQDSYTPSTTRFGEPLLPLKSQLYVVYTLFPALSRLDQKIKLFTSETSSFTLTFVHKVLWKVLKEQRQK